MAGVRSVTLIAFGLVIAVSTTSVSPVQKVVELLEECKAKVQKDLDAEAKAMEEYTTFCDDELSAKGYAIKTAESSIADLTADIEDASAQIAEEEDEVTSLGSEIAAKDKELTKAHMVRTAAHDVFVASEKEMLTSIDELMGAIAQIKQGMVSFTQGSAKAVNHRLESTIQALGRIVEAESL